MNRQELTRLILEKKSYLCIGLDTDIARIPPFLKDQFEDPVFEFNKRVIDATIDLAVAYKPNLAFYESRGSAGWLSLEKTIGYLRRHAGQAVFAIADAKRGDIGNSSEHYAKAFFESMDFDALTVNPYMGHDAVGAFLNYPGKWAIVLALTSNPGASDFQILQPQLPALLEKFGIKTTYWKKLFEVVIETSLQWGSPDNLMYVTGATQTDLLVAIREIVPDHFMLVPGVGTQGGNLQDISRVLFNKNVGLIVNVSRSVIFASNGSDFDASARQAALAIQQQMQDLLKQQSYI